jgi:hypothetical protein
LIGSRQLSKRIVPPDVEASPIRIGYLIENLSGRDYLNPGDSLSFSYAGGGGGTAIYQGTEIYRPREKHPGNEYFYGLPYPDGEVLGGWTHDAMIFPGTIEDVASVQNQYSVKYYSKNYKVYELNLWESSGKPVKVVSPFGSAAVKTVDSWIYQGL